MLTHTGVTGIYTQYLHTHTNTHTHTHTHTHTGVTGIEFYAQKHIYTHWSHRYSSMLSIYMEARDTNSGPRDYKLFTSKPFKQPRQ
jgi:hypothetical protein